MSHKPKAKTRYIKLFLTGFGMGSADIVPGVSGGTIAFIFGIYEELINSIKIATGPVLKHLIKFKIKKAIKLIPINFLVPLFLGIFTALFSLAKLLSYLLENQPVYIWSFFFGLVLASIFVVKQKIKIWKNKYTVGIIISTIIAYQIVGLVPVETSPTPIAFFFSGVIAICAMILPGISGSFLLILMGKYQQILNAVVEKDIATLVVFTTGTIVGISMFSRILSWLFKHYHDLTVSILIGFLIGSLRKIWPWKITVETYTDRHGEIIPLVQNNIIPNFFTSSTITAIILMTIGVIFILYLNKFQNQSES